MSSVNPVSAYGTTTAAGTTTTTAKADNKASSSSNSSSSSFNDTAAVYEKSENSSKKTGSTTDRSSIVRQLKADADARKQQLVDIVKKSLSQQASTYNKSQGLASVFSNLTVSDDVRAQAQKDIAKDGYWGVEQTSDRILDFAKALAGNDSSKAEELLAAFKKGYQKATGAWGSELPGICQETYAAVEQKFQKWMNGTE